VRVVVMVMLLRVVVRVADVLLYCMMIMILMGL